MNAPAPTLAELIRTFGRIGLINFGGPAGQIALMQKVLVDDKRWLSQDVYLQALNFCTLLPGPEAQQLATYAGWKLHGLRGGLAAGLLFILPGAAVILALSILYAYAADLDAVRTAFVGVKAAVLAIVLQALIRISRRALDTAAKIGLAVAAFVALFALHAPFPGVLVIAGLIGMVLASAAPDALNLAPRIAAAEAGPLPPLSRLARTVATWTAIWAAPILLALLALGPDHVLVKLGLLFSKLAVVTFGGAYAVLSYLAQQAVENQWLTAGEMVDGLGLAETTPGPLILVTQFVGFLAAFRAPAPFAPLLAGVLGAAMALWATFAPCFLWIFAGAPYVEHIRRAPRLQGALAAITAAVVGVIANLAAWFGLHVLFREFARIDAGPFRFDAPVWDSLSPMALALTGVAAILLFAFRLGVVATLAGCAILALILGALGWSA